MPEEHVLFIEKVPLAAPKDNNCLQMLFNMSRTPEVRIGSPTPYPQVAIIYAESCVWHSRTHLSEPAKMGPIRMRRLVLPTRFAELDFSTFESLVYTWGGGSHLTFLGVFAFQGVCPCLCV